jgi:acetyl esterase
MPLDPQAQAIIDMAIKAARPPFYDLPSASAAREQFKATRGPLMQASPEVGEARDLSIPGPAGEIPARSYRPLGSKPGEALPALVYFHGGGWVVGDLDTHDPLCRQLANDARCLVLAVDYRLAPEHKFPAAFDDALAATRYALSAAATLGVDSKRIAVGGDSAGGNLAAAVALACRDQGGPPLKFQLHIYPAMEYAPQHEWPSYGKYGDGYLLTRELMVWFWNQYLPGASAGEDWRASPLKAKDFSRLPPAYIAAAGHDPLRDEGKAYADKLKAAGVPAQYKCHEGMIHGFFIYGKILNATDGAIKEAAAALAQAFR